MYKKNDQEDGNDFTKNFNGIIFLICDVQVVFIPKMYI